MGGRVCTKCKTAKPLEDFRMDSSRKFGRSYICKPCNAEKDRIRYVNDIENQRKRGIEFYAKNSTRQKRIHKMWYNTNVVNVLAYNSKRRAFKVKATPPWLTAIHEAKMQEMYNFARAKTEETGVEHHVDHIFPLKGQNFSGLHVPWNLQVISAFENLSKKNRFPVQYQHLAWEC